MIGSSTYIRQFTEKQRQQMEAVQEQEKLNTVPDILFFALDQYTEQKNTIDRLKRIIEYKQRKIEELREENENLKQNPY